MESIECPVCGQISKYTQLNKACDDASPLSYYFDCPRCSEYFISFNAKTTITATRSNIPERKLANLSSWLRENKNSTITEKNINFLLELPTIQIKERIDRLLSELNKRTNHIGEIISIDSNDDYIIALTWSINGDELLELVDYLIQRKYVIDTLNEIGSILNLKITIDGFEYLSSIQSTNAHSQKAFVAMWFDESMTKIYHQAIVPAIINAGYNPHRVDQGEFINKIDDEIIAEIKKSCFIVADYTNHRGGVYYEAGFAHGLGLPVVMTCRDDHGPDLHFDIRQYNCILWNEDKLDDFKKMLTSRIEAVLGHGHYIKDI
jgi:hypothetical protein